MYIVDPHEKKLWDKVKPYLDKNGLRKDAPPEVVSANNELERLAWENPDQ